MRSSPSGGKPARNAGSPEAEDFDQLCRKRFLLTYEAAARGDLNEWELTPEGSLAVVLLLDQFPRNMFRGTRRVYATDPAALMSADRAIEKGYDRRVDPELRRFLYLPFMHSEELRHQERSVVLNESLGDAEFDEMGASSPRHRPPLRPVPAPERTPGPREHARGEAVPERERVQRVGGPPAPRDMAAIPVRDTSTRPTAVISLMKRSTSSVVPVSS